MAESVGLPGPGCLVANAMTETAPHDQDVATKVTEHNQRLTEAFKTALRSAAPNLSGKDIASLGAFLTLTAQGLWSISRATDQASELRDYVGTLLDLLETRIAP
ncbi:MAG: hypothetical protein ACE37M_08535 [Henriciella sp.]